MIFFLVYSIDPSTGFAPVRGSVLVFIPGKKLKFDVWKRYDYFCIMNSPF